MNRMRRAQSSMLSKFSRLSQGEKLIFVGAAAVLLSLFLPWYHDMDAWGKGDTYLGITGPLSIIGLVILGGTGAVFVKMLGRMTGKEVRSLRKFKDLSMYVAAQNALLFVIAASIYFDPKFGVNITLKETAFGLFLCLIGSVVMGFGGYVRRKEPETPELNVFEEVENNIDRMHKDIMKKHEEIQEEMSLAEKEYREMKQVEEKETLKMDL